MSPRDQLLVAVVTGLAVGTLTYPVLAVIDGLNDRYVRGLRASMERLRVSVDWLRAGMRLWWGVLFGTLALFWVGFGMPPVACSLAFLIYLAPNVILARWVERRRVRLRDQMVLATRQIAAQVRAGLDLPKAIRSVATDFPWPLGVELREVADAYRDGIALDVSLPALQGRLRIDAVSLFVIAVLICQRQGGSLPDALATISRSLEEIQRVERKKESDTASGWLLVKLLAVFPVLFLGGYTALDPDTTRVMYTTWQGQVVLSVVILMVAFCIWIAGKILANIK